MFSSVREAPWTNLCMFQSAPLLPEGVSSVVWPRWEVMLQKVRGHQEKEVPGIFPHHLLLSISSWAWMHVTDVEVCVIPINIEQAGRRRDFFKLFLELLKYLATAEFPGHCKCCHPVRDSALTLPLNDSVA